MVTVRVAVGVARGVGVRLAVIVAAGAVGVAAAGVEVVVARTVPVCGTFRTTPHLIPKFAPVFTGSPIGFARMLMN